MGKKLTIVAPPQPPAPLAPPPWPSVKQMKALTDKFDALQRHSQAMWMWCTMLEARTDEDDLCRARRCLEQYQMSNIRAALLNGELDRLSEACCPSDWWDDDDNVQESAVARAVTMLLGMFPNGPKDPEIFIPQMIEEVHLWSPHFFTMHDASRALYLTLKFAPSIAELTEAHDEAREKWIERWNARDDAENIAETLAKRIAEAEIKLAAHREAEAAKAARAEQRRKHLAAQRTPLAVGDRVRHNRFGAGVLIERTVEVTPNSICYNAWTVKFDQESEPRCVVADYLERLIEGDEGFAPPAS